MSTGVDADSAGGSNIVSASRVLQAHSKTICAGVTLCRLNVPVTLTAHLAAAVGVHSWVSFADSRVSFADSRDNLNL